ncbi:MAG TPA: M23 family metallopeptidase, partial [Chloroflexota bacterium]|nr:M23 family metallopeptidase [Chloroflexota bacterium]
GPWTGNTHLAPATDALDTAKDDYNRLHDGVALLQEQERRQREEAQKRAEAEAAAKAAAARAAASRAADARRPPAKAPAKPAAKRNAAVAGAKWVFPVQGPNSFSHSFGAPRYAGGYHTHKGVDIMAPRGTPVVAVTAGVIRSTSPVERGLGGITIHLRGSDGNVYYYAHLSSVKNGIAPGVRVKAGQLIGYVGNTGDARSTAPHLHFEIRPGGGAAIDPYPTLIKYR